MGSFFTNIQVRSDDFDGTINALRGCNGFPLYLSKKAQNGWISLFPEATESQDQDLIRKMVQSISKTLTTAAFGVLVHDSDIFWYVLAENGSVVDVYDSDPGYFGSSASAPSGGKMELLARYCTDGTTEFELASIFKKKPKRTTEQIDPFKMMEALKNNDLNSLMTLQTMMGSDEVFRGDSLARKFAEKLGLPPHSVCMGYKTMNEVRGRIPGITHITDPDRPIVPQETRSGPPRLIAGETSDLAGGTRTRGGKRGLSLVVGSASAPSDKLQREAGQDLAWVGTVQNSGGYASGLRFTLQGPLLSEDSLSERCVYVIRQANGSEEDDDYEVPDPEDEDFWPFVGEFKQTDDPHKWQADVPNFSYEQKFAIQLPIILELPGEYALTLNVSPLNGSDSESASFQIKAQVEETKPKWKLVQSEPKQATAGPFMVSVPGDYDIHSKSGNEFMSGLGQLLGGAGGVIGQVLATKNKQCQARLSVCGMDSQLAKNDFDAMLKANRVRNKIRNFDVSKPTTANFNDIEWTYVHWNCPDLRLYGIIGSGRYDDKFLSFGGQCKGEAGAKEFEEMMKSVRVLS